MMAPLEMGSTGEKEETFVPDCVVLGGKRRSLFLAVLNMGPE